MVGKRIDDGEASRADKRRSQDYWRTKPGSKPGSAQVE
jgi:hypothetical protein